MRTELRTQSLPMRWWLRIKRGSEFECDLFSTEQTLVLVLTPIYTITPNTTSYTQTHDERAFPP